MRIREEQCVGCKNCIPYCPVGCIMVVDGKVAIDHDECVDCGVCKRADICPTDAIYMPSECFEYPRAIRMQFSDPGVQHPNLKAWGRGTEEAKTNDVTGKFGRGEYGLLIEFGRPGTGTRLTEIEKVTMAMCKMGIPILEDNPLYGLLEEDMSGRFKPEYVNEKVLSAILELRIMEDKLEETLEKMFLSFEALNTVVSVGLVSRFDENSKLPVIEKLRRMGFDVRPNAKINVGLGRPLID
ncbi:indolepyruvate ferredoxin oxidoreductase subunit alpha [Aminiphilus circumscriptus]|uniref:indolepyruvate ferredoxin oxidoreductase subunit alpha n=1 Tax=Aminiphilus circumscriptus TaxID=290732 RepID=UPI000492CECD|nr:4Fe-4S binding protein [Aminiphilus circumscriptus]